MLRKVVKFTNFNDEEVSEVLYFNLTKTEILALNHEYQNGLSAKIQDIVDSVDPYEIYEFFKDLVSRSYGIKSQDGNSFMKSKPATDEFLQGLAFESFLFGILEADDNGKQAADFIKAIVPQDLLKEIEKAETAN